MIINRQLFLQCWLLACVGLYGVIAWPQSTVERDFGLITAESAQPSVAAASNQVIWEGQPIAIPLSMSQERSIQFFDTIQTVALKPEVQGANGLLQYEVYGNHLMLRLNEDVRTRIKVVLLNNVIVPLDLSLSGGTTIDTQSLITINQPSTKVERERRKVYTLNGQHQAGPDSALDAVRIAFQQFYAPKRLQEGAEALEVQSLPKYDEPLQLYRSNQVQVRPLIAWHYRGLYVTALEVTNQLSVPVVLDPQRLRGHFRLASFYRSKLHPKGDQNDETLLVLVSKAPFETAIGPWGGVYAAKD